MRLRFSLYTNHWFVGWQQISSSHCSVKWLLVSFSFLLGWARVCLTWQPVPPVVVAIGRDAREDRPTITRHVVTVVRAVGAHQAMASVSLMIIATLTVESAIVALILTVCTSFSPIFSKQGQLVCRNWPTESWTQNVSAEFILPLIILQGGLVRSH